MAKLVTISLEARDARPILDRAAYEAARYGSLVDYITLQTWNAPGSGSIADLKVEWRRKFLAAKRVVESFGVEYVAVSEEDTVNPRGHVPYIGGKRERLAGFDFVTGAKPDPNPKNHKPQYRGAHHLEACKKAAEQTVALWAAELNKEEKESTDA